MTRAEAVKPDTTPTVDEPEVQLEQSDGPDYGHEWQLLLRGVVAGDR